MTARIYIFLIQSGHVAEREIHSILRLNVFEILFEIVVNDAILEPCVCVCVAFL